MTVYDCVGCIKKGPERIAYILHNKELNKQIKVNKFTMAVLVGRKQVSNAKGDIYRDIVIYRGVGCDFSKLPALKLNEDGTKKTKEQLITEATERKAKRVQKVEEIAKNKAGRPSNEQLKAKYIEQGQSIIDSKYLEKWNNMVERNYASINGRLVLSNVLKCMQMIKKGVSYTEIADKLAKDEKNTVESYGVTLHVVASLMDNGNRLLDAVGLMH